MNFNSNIKTHEGLLILLKAGDSGAFEKIYNLYWHELYQTSFKRIKDQSKCQDIIQNVFTDLWNRRAELDIKDLQAYLHTAVRYQTLKTISKESKHTPFTDSFETDIISPLQTDDGLLNKDAKQLVELFIKALPEKRRTIFVMHHFDELSTAEIASQLGISQKTVQNQLHTASHALRLRLNQLFSLTIIISILHQ